MSGLSPVKSKRQSRKRDAEDEQPVLKQSQRLKEKASQEKYDPGYEKKSLQEQLNLYGISNSIIPDLQLVLDNEGPEAVSAYLSDEWNENDKEIIIQDLVEYDALDKLIKAKSPVKKAAKSAAKEAGVTVNPTYSKIEKSIQAFKSKGTLHSFGAVRKNNYSAVGAEEWSRLVDKAIRNAGLNESQISMIMKAKHPKGTSFEVEDEPRVSVSTKTPTRSPMRTPKQSSTTMTSARKRELESLVR